MIKKRIQVIVKRILFLALEFGIQRVLFYFVFVFVFFFFFQFKLEERGKAEYAVWCNTPSELVLIELVFLF